MALQIQGVPAFNPDGDQTSLSQRWTKWIKRFEYFITASFWKLKMKNECNRTKYIQDLTLIVYELFHDEYTLSWFKNFC